MKPVKIYEGTRDAIAKEVVEPGTDLRWNYIGRGEHHRCAALYAENAHAANSQFARFLMSLAIWLESSDPDGEQEMDWEDWTLWKKDSLGQGIVFYWPNVVSDEA